MGFTALGLQLLLLEETYPPVILVNKAADLRRRTKNWGIHAKQEEIEIDLRELLEKNLSRPMRMLFTEPVCSAVSPRTGDLLTSHVYRLCSRFRFTWRSSTDCYTCCSRFTRLSFNASMV
jgi:hypothetical protein